MTGTDGDLSSGVFRLRLLGPVELEGPGGEEIRPLLAQPKRMALLAYLAAATPSGSHRRDRLVALFWPESDQSHARNALSQALRFLKRGLGPDVILTRGTEDVGLNPERISVDVTRFRESLGRGDHRGSLTLYRGDLMDAFFLSDCPAFEEWLERERGTLRGAAAAAAWSEAQRLLRAGDPVEAERSARRGMELVPSNEGAVRDFMEALAGAGERAAAVGLYDRFRQTLWHGLALEPSTRTRDLADSLRDPDWDSARDRAAPGGGEGGLLVRVCQKIPGHVSGAP
jgi:serine/threonine-protein kinase